MIGRAYAVSNKPIKRKKAVSINSTHWTLYNPQELANELNLELNTVDKALEKTGFNKAVRIREELLKYKTRLLKEQKEINKRRSILKQEIAILNNRDNVIKDILVNVRNILRIPRDKEVENE